MRWDIFCKVIDNHGDIGVCWRLASDLAGRGDTVALWVDDPSALAWMAPAGRPGVTVHPWRGRAEGFVPGDAVVEAFGCTLGHDVEAALAQAARAGRASAWINLEYLSAEAWVERCHGLPSPVQAGSATGLVKRFFYPGFTPATGGLLREPDVAARQAAFDRSAWLATHGIADDGCRLVSLFCYEPAALPALLAQLADGPVPTRLLVTAGRATAAARAALASQNGPQPARRAGGALSISYLPLLPQPEFDHLLWSCDFNLVRGEDSLVRALWAGVPFAWQLYPQADGAHLPKLQAFLNRVDAPASLRAFHAAWNADTAPAEGLPPLELPAWRAATRRARDAAWAQPDLASQLRASVVASA